MNCGNIWPYNKIPHDLYWTETWANYLSKQYFGINWHGWNKLIKGMEKLYYPVKNISHELFKKKFGL